jgi:hypothetical protein
MSKGIKLTRAINVMIDCTMQLKKYKEYIYIYI